MLATVVRREKLQCLMWHNQPVFMQMMTTYAAGRTVEGHAYAGGGVQRNEPQQIASGRKPEPTFSTMCR